MIGVVADPSEHVVVREFFELFKTPWEFYQSGRKYDVLLCAGDHEFKKDTARLVLIYAGRKLALDTEINIQLAGVEDGNSILSYRGRAIPIYGDRVVFRGQGNVTLIDQDLLQPTVHVRQLGARLEVRIGYDLFKEIRTLLTVGQPPANADTPTLELHIALLRHLIIASGLPLVEIPPVPEGYRFIACLTHDVDHPSVQAHKLDHTMLGFLYRAVLKTPIEVLRGRAPLRNLFTNWAAVCKLPLIHLGWAKDFWTEFDHYLELEKGLPSSFFFIPFKGCAGLNGKGRAPKWRAARYGANQYAAEIQQLVAAGCEVGVHGIDAWNDSASGREELEEVRRITGSTEIGIRMHWLYFDEQSPMRLENAGASYDSTVGYNQTVGYRAGTSQVYKPLETTGLLELPLHIMDTALFFPNYLNCTGKQARERIREVVRNAVQLGGIVTVNWHDRSLAPERLWGDAYLDLLDELKKQGAWFATAGDAVRWFSNRRATVFDYVSWTSNALRVKVGVKERKELPGLLLRTHGRGGAYKDVAVGEGTSDQTNEITGRQISESCTSA